MTRQVLFFASMTFSALPAFSQGAAAPERVLTVTPAFVTAFIDRGVYTSGLSFQPTIEYSSGGLTFELFSNLPVLDKISETADPQVDLAASYTWDVAQGAFRMAPNILLSTFPRANGDTEAICEVGLSFGRTVADDLELSLDFWYDVVQKGGGVELGIDYSLPVKPLGVGIELSAQFGRYDLTDAEVHAPEKIRNNGDYFCVGVSFPFEFSEKSKLTAGWFYAKGANNYIKVASGPKEPNPDAFGRGFFAIGFSRSF